MAYEALINYDAGEGIVMKGTILDGDPSDDLLSLGFVRVIDEPLIDSGAVELQVEVIPEAVASKPRGRGKKAKG